jgi:tetratricopeptide (TPR) repeat protein
MKPDRSQDFSPLYEPAIGCAETGRFSEAVTRALDVASGNEADEAKAAAAQVLFRIARLADAGDDLLSAERALEQAVRLRPGFADVHFHLGSVLARRGRRADARRELERALDQNAGYLAARVELAMLDAREGRIGEALESLRALQQDARIAEPRAFQQGLTRLESADWDAADALIRRAVQSSDPRIERTIADYRTLMAQGAAARAADVLADLIERHSSYPDLYALLGAAEIALGHYDDAIDSIARALELNPAYHAARIQLAVALDALGDRASAIDQLTMILDADPEQAAAREMRDRWGRARPTSDLTRGRESSHRKDA